MRRKYEVFIGGKPVVIAEQASRGDGPDNWLILRVHAYRELAPVIQLFEEQENFQGLLLHSPDLRRLWTWFRDPYERIKAAGGTVTDERGRLLMIKRSGIWDLPKGKRDKGESIANAAVREVKEECGLQRVQLIAPLCSTWHTYSRKGRSILKRTDWFQMRASNREQLVPEVEENIEEVKWMTPLQVQALRKTTYPSLIRVLDAWVAVRSRT